jgi:hypothetical protein
VDAFLIDPSELAAACQRKFACSSTVGELPGKGAGMEVGAHWPSSGGEGGGALLLCDRWRPPSSTRLLWSVSTAQGTAGPNGRAGHRRGRM